MKLIFACLAILQWNLTVGCAGVGIDIPKSEPVVPEEGEGYLMFDLQPLETTATRQRYDCTFKAEGKTARFQLEVTSGASSGNPPIAFTSGRIMASPGSDASVLLRKLQKTLEAKTVPMSTKRVAEIQFDAAILGTNQSHAKDGGFFTKPPGNWTAMKIFIGKKDDPAEVFLNFNPVLRKGEFSIKDPDYGDAVLRELAKVL